MPENDEHCQDGNGLPRPWPFDQPPTGAAITSRQVLHLSEPILEVFHSPGGHGWHFHTKGEFSMEDSLCVSMKTIVLHDFTVTEVADLPAGWMAWREAQGQPWKRRQREI
jgi:hypothetical protein